MAEQSAPEPASLGGYELDRKVTSDAYGDTYVGHRDGRRDVVTVLGDRLVIDVLAARRFAEEAQRLHGLEPVGVLPVTGFDFDTRPRWIATEFITGRLLAQHVESVGPLSQQSTRLLANQLAQSLQGLHARAIVQRDLSPSSVLLTQEGSRIWRTGWAGLVDGSEYAGTMHTEHVEWLAPEQVLGETSGPASDVHAWAVTILFAATGHNPFAGAKASESVSRLIRETPLIPAVFDPVLASLISGSLDKQPSARPTAEDLLRFLDPEVSPVQPKAIAVAGGDSSDPAEDVDHTSVAPLLETPDEVTSTRREADGAQALPPPDLVEEVDVDEHSLLDVSFFPDDGIHYTPANAVERRIGYGTVGVLTLFVAVLGSAIGLVIGRVLGG